MTTRARTLLLGAAALALMAGPAGAQNQNPGETAYNVYCAQCHGASARGDGPLARFLTVPPADLTTLRQRDPDKEFPFYRVFQTVDGRTLVPAHGTRDMPAWGQIFALGAERYGPYGAETYIRGRIVEIVQYIESLQR